MPVFSRRDWIRIALVLPFVLLCHAFQWNAWRSFNCTVYLQVAHLLGIPSQRLTPTAFSTLHHVYFFATACTAIDAYFGSIPLLWELGKSWLANLGFFAGYLIVLFAANITRLALGMLVFVWGVPWWMSHEVLSGLCYFAMFLWIAHRRGWTAGRPPRPVAGDFPSPTIAVPAPSK